MKLTTKSEYACLALLDLAERYLSGLTKTDDIAKRRKIPKKYLEQILLQLNKSGYVKSRRGIDGGYELSKEPGEITLAEIIRLMDGPLAPIGSASRYFYQPTPLEQSKQLMFLMKDIRDYISQKLEGTTLADIVER